MYMWSQMENNQNTGAGKMTGKRSITDTVNFLAIGLILTFGLAIIEAELFNFFRNDFLSDIEFFTYTFDLLFVFGILHYKNQV